MKLSSFTQIPPLATAFIVGTLLVTGCGESIVVMQEHTTDARYRNLVVDDGSPIHVCVGKVGVKWNSNRNGGLPGADWPTPWTYLDVIGAGNAHTRVVSRSASAHGQRDGMIWANAIRSSIAATLERRSRELGYNIVFVDRDNLEQRLDERDLVIADVVQGDSLLARGRELGIDLWIFGTLNIQVDTVSDYKVPAHHRLLNPLPIVGRFVDTSKKEYVTRSIVISGNLRAVDNVTGQMQFSHAIEGERVEDEKPILMVEASEADLTPETSEIRDIVDTQVAEFLGNLVPITIRKTVEVKASGNKFSKQGLNCLARKQYVDARAAFEKATAENSDDHKSYYGAGFASEMLGDLARAAESYELAITYGGSDVDDADEYEHHYRIAFERVRKRWQGRLASSQP